MRVLILDINNTLGYRCWIARKGCYPDHVALNPRQCDPTKPFHACYFYWREGAKDLLKQIGRSKSIDAVGIFTSGERLTSEPLVDFLQNHCEKPFSFCFFRDSCEKTSTASKGKEGHPLLRTPRKEGHPLLRTPRKEGHPLLRTPRKEGHPLLRTPRKEGHPLLRTPRKEGHPLLRTPRKKGHPSATQKDLRTVLRLFDMWKERYPSTYPGVGIEDFIVLEDSASKYPTVEQKARVWVLDPDTPIDAKATMAAILAFPTSSSKMK